MTAVLEPPTASEATLEELAATANNEHLCVLESGEAMVEHAILAGESLLAARALMPSGDWLDWVSDNIMAKSLDTLQTYMRLAEFKDVVRAGHCLNIAAGVRLLRTQGLTRYDGHPFPDEIKQEAKRLRDAGVSLKETAQLLDVSTESVRKWTCPDKAAHWQHLQRERNKRRTAERRALRAQERRQATVSALKGAPDPAGRAHEATTKMDKWLGQWREQATSGEQRVAINKAHALRDQLMDAIDEALRLGYVA